jgi:hypothetical protein
MEKPRACAKITTKDRILKEVTMAGYLVGQPVLIMNGGVIARGLSIENDEAGDNCCSS